MRGLILAAGRGSRMGSLTNERPKCMVELAGRPLLAWQISALKDAGVEEISIVTGYRKNEIPARYKQIENPHWAATNMVCSLMCADAVLTEHTCIISYSDIFFEAEAVRLLGQCRADIAVLYDVNWREQWEDRFEDPLSDAETFRIDSKSRILEIGNRADSMEEIQGQYMGLLRFTQNGWANSQALLNTLNEEEIGKLSMTAMLNQLIQTGVTVTGVPFVGLWGEIDSETDLKAQKKRIVAALGT